MSAPLLLILGGTTEGYALAEALAECATPWRVLNSLAGRTENPRLPRGETRIGGFGGVEGLSALLRERQVRAVIDATHPFASTMGWNAAAACASLGVPLLRLERAPWRPQPGDDWVSVSDWGEAVAELRQSGARRVLLALGRQELAPFTTLDHIAFVIRLVSAPEPRPAFAQAKWIFARGPFDLAAERALFDDYAIDTLVCKNSGGTATSAKLEAARERGVRVLMRERPARPPIESVATVSEALAWLAGRHPAA